MNPNCSCPPPEKIMAWLDGEYQDDEKFNKHVAQCVHCQRILATLSEENKRLGILFDDIQALPDFTDRVMEKAVQPATGVRGIRLFLIILPLLLAAFYSGVNLLFSQLPPSATHLWPRGYIEILSSLITIFLHLVDIGSYILTKVIQGGEVIPSLLVAFLVLLIPLFQKRSIPVRK